MFFSHTSRMTTTTTTTNFTKCHAFRDRAKSGSFLSDEETGRRADRKFKWDLRQSLARKLIVITGADRPARLISWTIYDGPAARDRSLRSPPTNWESRIDLALRNATFKSAVENDERFASRCGGNSGAGIAISSLDIFYIIRGKLPAFIRHAWMIGNGDVKFPAHNKLDWNEMKNFNSFFF